MNIDTSNLDYMQTILKLTGLSDKQPVGFPGRSFTELLKGRMGKWFCTYSDPAIDGVRSAFNGSGQLCRPGCMQFMRIPLHQRAWNDYELFVKE